MSEGIRDICSRVYFGATPIVQPSHETYAKLKVCAGCASSCMSYTPSAGASDDPFVCQCSPCLFERRHGEGAPDVIKQQALHALEEEVTRALERETEVMAQRARRAFSADVLRGIATTPRHFEFSAPKDLPPDDTVIAVAQHISKSITLSYHSFAPVSPPNRIFYSGSLKERCAVLMALLYAVGIESRIVYSVHGPESDSVCWPECLLKVNGNPQWKCVSIDKCKITDEPQIGRSLTGHVLVAMEASGYLTDVTAPNARASYRPSVLASQLLEHNMQLVETNPKLADRAAPEISAASAALSQELAQQHSNAIGDPTKVCDDFMTANANICRSTVDNDSQVPLRTVLAEVEPVQQLHYAAFCEDGNQMLASTKAFALLIRSMNMWRREDKHIVVRMLDYIFSSLVASPECSSAIALLSSGGGFIEAAKKLANPMDAPQTPFLISLVACCSNILTKAADQTQVFRILPSLLDIFALASRRANDSPVLLYGLFQAVQAVMETLMAVGTAECISEREMGNVVRQLCTLLADLILAGMKKCSLFPSVSNAITSVTSGLFESNKSVVGEVLRYSVRCAAQRIPLSELRDAAENEMFK